MRDNITFGRDFSQERYDMVTQACSLDHDLEILPYGSSTEIGERGINLSGGQKQRVSLARAMYFDADVVILNDPLAAVDPHVGAHIMDQAICGFLKDKCRILATTNFTSCPDVTGSPFWTVEESSRVILSRVSWRATQYFNG